MRPKRNVRYTELSVQLLAFRRDMSTHATPYKSFTKPPASRWPCSSSHHNPVSSLLSTGFSKGGGGVGGGCEFWPSLLELTICVSPFILVVKTACAHSYRIAKKETYHEPNNTMTSDMKIMNSVWNHYTHVNKMNYFEKHLPYCG